MSAATKATYGERAARHNNPAAKALLSTMQRKQTNLCVSVDVTTKAAFLAVVDAVGPFVCLIKARLPPPHILIAGQLTVLVVRQ